MAILVDKHVLVLRPDHLILVLRDVDCDAGEGAGEAITQAQGNVAASSGYGIYVETAQNFIASRVEVEVWDAEPATGDLADGWIGPVVLDLDCPTGDLQVGDDMGNAISGIVPPQGPGRYRIHLYHHGRADALEHEKELAAAQSAGHDGQYIDDLRSGREGTERYLIRLWRQAPLPEDDDESDY